MIKISMIETSFVDRAGIDLGPGRLDLGMDVPPGVLGGWHH